MLKKIAQEILNFAASESVWYAFFTLVLSLCILMVLLGQQSYLLSATCLVLAHIWRANYKYLKRFFDQAKNELEQERNSD